MTTTQPEISPSGLYGAKEAAEALKIDRSTLHRYTKAGICKATTRRASGRRVWKGSELLRLWYYCY